MWDGVDPFGADPLMLWLLVSLLSSFRKWKCLVTARVVSVSSALRTSTMFWKRATVIARKDIKQKPIGDSSGEYLAASAPLELELPHP